MVDIAKSEPFKNLTISNNGLFLIKSNIGYCTVYCILSVTATFTLRNFG